MLLKPKTNYFGTAKGFLGSDFMFWRQSTLRERANLPDMPMESDRGTMKISKTRDFQDSEIRKSLTSGFESRR